MGDEERVRQLFDGKASSWHAKYDGPLRARRDAFREQLRRHAFEGARFLDFGCGSGALLLEAARLGYSVCGVDISKEMIAEARSQLAANGIEGTLHHGQLEDVDADLDTFDVIVCSSVLEYVPDLDATLESLVRHLSSRGVIVATVPNRESWERRLEALVGRTVRIWRCLPSRRVGRYLDYLELSTHRFTEEQLRAFAPRVGLEVVSCELSGASPASRLPPRLAAPMIMAVLRQRP